MMPAPFRTLALAGIALATSLHAAPAAAQDPRLVDLLYDPDEVVRIEGRTNVQSTIRFGEGESIENVAIGDSQSWQVTPNRRANLLFVKPLAPRATTNMTVVTNRHTYLFDLVASPTHRTPLYILSFTYPPHLQPAPAEDDTQLAGRGEGANALELAAVNDDYAVVDPASLNFAWQISGAAALLPQRIYDDGTATFIEWRDDQAMPAILVRDHEGTEGPVNFASRGNVIVLDTVPAEIILRSGDDAALLFNTAVPAEQGDG